MVPPALSWCLFWRPGGQGQPSEVVSAINRSGSAMSSSINHESGSNRSRRATKSCKSAEPKPSPDFLTAQRSVEFGPSSRSRIPQNSPLFDRISVRVPRSGSPFWRIVANPPSACHWRRKARRLDIRAEGSTSLAVTTSCRNSPARLPTVRCDERREGAGAAGGTPRPPRRRFAPPRRTPAAPADPAAFGARLPAAIGWVKWRLKAVSAGSGR